MNESQEKKYNKTEIFIRYLKDFSGKDHLLGKSHKQKSGKDQDQTGNVCGRAFFMKENQSGEKTDGQTHLTECLNITDI